MVTRRSSTDGFPHTDAIALTEADHRNRLVGLLRKLPRHIAAVIEEDLAAEIIRRDTQDHRCTAMAAAAVKAQKELIRLNRGK